MFICGQWSGDQKKETELCKTNLIKDNEDIAKHTLEKEMTIGLNGLADECHIICKEINTPEITNNSVLYKCEIKSAVQKAITSFNKTQNTVS